jgi:hypothetical protein
MAIQIGNQGTITASRSITVDSAKQSYAFSVYINGDACAQNFGQYLIYSASPVLGIGSTLYTDLALTIPTTYSAISDPVDAGYYGLSGNTIISDNGCD